MDWANYAKSVNRVILCSICTFCITLGPSFADDDEDRDHREQSRIVKCDKGRSLQKAFDKASPGDTIRVRGVCEENVSLDVDRVTVECMPGGGVTGVSEFTAFVVSASNATIEGCKISAGGARLGAIAVLGNGSALITGNTIDGGTATGTSASQGSYARIVGNTITGGTGVRASGNAALDVADNEISVTGFGISVSDSSTADIVGNTITGPEPTDAFNVGLFIQRNAVVTLSNDVSLGSAPNTVEKFFRGIDCRSGSVIRSGALQDDGAGNQSANLRTDGTCHLDLPGSANGDGFLPAP